MEKIMMKKQIFEGNGCFYVEVTGEELNEIFGNEFDVSSTYTVYDDGNIDNGEGHCIEYEYVGDDVLKAWGLR